MSEPGLGAPEAMPRGYRFRTNWRGKLILQRMVKQVAGDAYDCWDVAIWRDATTEDLTHFFTNQGT